MTSQTGSRKKSDLKIKWGHFPFNLAPPFFKWEVSPFNFSGFTLIELTLVAIIILVLATLSTPMFKRTYEDLKLTSSVKELAAVMKFSQEAALSERRPLQLCLDQEKRHYRILGLDEQTGDFAPMKNRWGRLFRFPDGVSVESDTDTVDFYPSGKVSPAVIYFTNKEKRTYTVQTERTTGLIKIYDYKKQ